MIVCLECERPEGVVEQGVVKTITLTFESHQGCETCGGTAYIPDLDAGRCALCNGEGVFGNALCAACGGAGRPAVECPEPATVLRHSECQIKEFHCALCGADFVAPEELGSPEPA